MDINGFVEREMSQIAPWVDACRTAARCSALYVRAYCDEDEAYERLYEAWCGAGFEEEEKDNDS